MFNFVRIRVKLWGARGSNPMLQAVAPSLTLKTNKRASERIYGVWKNNIKLKPNKLYAVARSYPIERVVSKATPYLKLTSDKLKRQAQATSEE